MAIQPVESSITKQLQSIATAVRSGLVVSGGDLTNPSLSAIAGTDGKVSLALMEYLSQLSGPHNSYSKSYLNSTSLDSSQSIKVFLLTLMQALDMEHVSHPPIASSSISPYQKYHHPEANSLLEDEILDLVDDLHTTTTKTDPTLQMIIEKLQTDASRMTKDLQIDQGSTSLEKILMAIEQQILGSSKSGNFLSAQS